MFCRVTSNRVLWKVYLNKDLAHLAEHLGAVLEQLVKHSILSTLNVNLEQADLLACVVQSCKDGSQR